MHLPNKKDRLLILDLKLHFSFLSREIDPLLNGCKHLKPETKAFFSEYLTTKGHQLSEIPAVTKYFAVPYMKDPTSNPLFQEAFVPQWELLLTEELKYFLNQTFEKAQPTTLEACVANFSWFINASDEMHERGSNLDSANTPNRMSRKFVIKSSDNRKMLDMLSGRESISLGKADLSEWQSANNPEAYQTRTKMLDYKLMLQQKKHEMKLKQWENKEWLQKAHKKWIIFIK